MSADCWNKVSSECKTYRSCNSTQAHKKENLEQSSNNSYCSNNTKLEKKKQRDYWHILNILSTSYHWENNLEENQSDFCSGEFQAQCKKKEDHTKLSNCFNLNVWLKDKLNSCEAIEYSKVKCGNSGCLNYW